MNTIIACDVQIKFLQIKFVHNQNIIRTVRVCACSMGMSLFGIALQYFCVLFRDTNATWNDIRTEMSDADGKDRELRVRNENTKKKRKCENAKKRIWSEKLIYKSSERNWGIKIANVFEIE